MGARMIVAQGWTFSGIPSMASRTDFVPSWGEQECLEARTMLNGTALGPAVVSKVPARTFTVAVLSPTSVALNWTKVAGATGYAVELFYRGTWHQCGGTLKPQATSATVSGLTPGATYDV